MSEKPVSILYLEDNPGDVRLVQLMLLEGEGEKEFKLHHTSRLSQAADLLAKVDFDVCLLDLSLPDASQTDTVDVIRNLRPTLPIVVLSGTSDEGMGLLTVQKGVYNYLVKGETSETQLKRAIHYAMERKKIEMALEQRASESTRLKTGFAEAVAHELRTPITVIQNSTQMLAEALKGNKEVDSERMLEMLTRNTQRLIHLVNDVLNFQKLESGKQTFNMKPHDVRGLIEEAAGTFKPLAEKRGLNLLCEIEKDIPLVSCDREKIFQVLLHLVDNAIKFSAQGRVLIHAKAVREGLKISVTDTGTGIREEDKPLLFESFTQFAPEETRSGSVGLGLAIAKKIVEAHRGTIGAESVYGEGSTFFFTLPLA